MRVRLRILIVISILLTSHNLLLAQPPLVLDDPDVAVLPVTITSFTAAKLSAQSVEIKWQVLSEAVDGYTIEKSFDAIVFFDIGFLKAENKHSYNFIDANYSFSSVYYRLKMREKNGGTTYSTICSISDFNQNCRVFPVPSHSTITFQCGNNRLEGTTGFIVNSFGKTISSFIVNRITRLDISKMTKGLYFIKTKENSVSFIVD